MENATITKAFRTWMGQDGIARTCVIQNAHVDLDAAKDNSKAVNDLFVDKKFPLLIDITEIHSITKEARAHFSVRNRETNINSFALLTNSELGKIVANFFFSLNSPGVPARMFTKKEKALEWLSNFV